jgi:signal recognition particle receptor subunit beta
MNGDARRRSDEPTPRIVYYGPGLAGKTTNLVRLAAAVGIPDAVTVVETAAGVDRCEFLPLPWRDGDRTLHLFAVPGRMARAEERRKLLRGAAGVVFVADGRSARQDANLVLLDELGAHLAEVADAPAGFPLVLQYNHRDLPDAVPPPDMDRLLNACGWPAVPACALTGDGVVSTLETLLASFPPAGRPPR